MLCSQSDYGVRLAIGTAAAAHLQLSPGGNAGALTDGHCCSTRLIVGVPVLSALWVGAAGHATASPHSRTRPTAGPWRIGLW